MTTDLQERVPLSHGRARSRAPCLSKGIGPDPDSSSIALRRHAAHGLSGCALRHVWFFLRNCKVLGILGAEVALSSGTGEAYFPFKARQADQLSQGVWRPIMAVRSGHSSKAGPSWSESITLSHPTNIPAADGDSPMGARRLFRVYEARCSASFGGRWRTFLASSSGSSTLEDHSAMSCASQFLRPPADIDPDLHRRAERRSNVST